jgi:competence/damage-inducible protein CinA-like protein
MMPVLEIITIGTELLLGEITDTNSTTIARALRDHGIDIYRITTIGDNPKRISAAIKEALTRADIVITTGGLGPTVDDPTRQAVADATDRRLVFSSELWEQILTRFSAYGTTPTENNKRQAYIPEGAIPIPNPVGTAPCFIVEVGSTYVISLPGVPREMVYILDHNIIPYLKKKLRLESQIIKATVLHAASIGESMIDDLIGDLEEKANPTVGLLAHPGQVDIRVTAKGKSESEAMGMITPILDDLYRRLGDNIYGKDRDTLESVIGTLLEDYDLKLCIIEYGLDGPLIERMQRVPSCKIETMIQNDNFTDLNTFTDQLNQYCYENQCDTGFGLALFQTDQVMLHILYQNGNQVIAKSRFYGGPKENAQLWAQNVGLDFIRRNLQQFTGDKEIGEK